MGWVEPACITIIIEHFRIYAAVKQSSEHDAAAPAKSVDEAAGKYSINAEYCHGWVFFTHRTKTQEKEGRRRMYVH